MGWDVQFVMTYDLVIGMDYDDTRLNCANEGGECDKSMYGENHGRFAKGEKA